MPHTRMPTCTYCPLIYIDAINFLILFSDHRTLKQLLRHLYFIASLTTI
jgi:hypothetical protein